MIFLLCTFLMHTTYYIYTVVCIAKAQKTFSLPPLPKSSWGFWREKKSDINTETNCTQVDVKKTLSEFKFNRWTFGLSSFGKSHLSSWIWQLCLSQRLTMEINFPQSSTLWDVPCQLFMFQLDFSKEPSYLFIFLSLSFLSPIPDNGDILNIVTFQFLHIYIFLTSQTFHQETEEADKWLHLENYEPQWNTILRTVNTFLRVTLFFPFSSLTFPSASTFLSGFLGMPFLHKIFLHGV